MPNFEKRIPYAVFFLHAQRQCYLINTVKGGGTRTPRVTRYPRLSTMCVTRPPTCATQLEMGSNSLFRTCTLPCMSATTTPYDEDVIVEIEVPTRRICGLSARSCASLTGTTSKNGNCLHCETYQRAVRKQVEGTYSWREGGRRYCSRFGRRRGREHRFQGTTAHCGPEIPLSALASDSHTQPNRRRSRTAHSS